MNVKNVTDVPGVKMGKDVPGVTKQVLIGPADGAPTFVMRRFTLEPRAHTPWHEHDWEHEVMVVEGAGTLVGPEGEQPLKPGDVVYVPPGEVHQFRNAGLSVFRMLCLVPLRGEA